MSHTYEFAEIGGIRIKIADGTRGGGVVGDSQTVNVFDDSNTEGNYREVYRSTERDRWVGTAELEGVPSIEALDSYLRQRGFVAEGPRRVG